MFRTTMGVLTAITGLALYAATTLGALQDRPFPRRLFVVAARAPAAAPPTADIDELPAIPGTGGLINVDVDKVPPMMRPYVAVATTAVSIVLILIGGVFVAARTITRFQTKAWEMQTASLTADLLRKDRALEAINTQNEKQMGLILAMRQQIASGASCPFLGQDGKCSKPSGLAPAVITTILGPPNAPTRVPSLPGPPALPEAPAPPPPPAGERPEGVPSTKAGAETDAGALHTDAEAAVTADAARAEGEAAFQPVLEKPAVTKKLRRGKKP